MESVNNPNFLDIQYPNIIDTKKFGDAAWSEPMANAGSDNDKDVALRCRVLTRLYGKGSSQKFADEIGVGLTRWSNIENSGKLSLDMARRIIRKWPKVSLDWLWRGLDDGLSHQNSEELSQLYREVLAERRPSRTPKKAKRAG